MSNKNKKKILSIVMTFCLILGIIPTQNLVATYAGTAEETTPLTSVWREARLGITEGGTTAIGTDGSVSITGAGLRLSKTTYDPATATTQDNMYYSYIKSEGATVITTKLSSGALSVTPNSNSGTMSGIAIRGDGETTMAPYFAVYYDYSNSQFRYAYRNGPSATSTYKSGASAVAAYTPVTAYTDDVYVKITLEPLVDGSTKCSVFLSTTGVFAATANKSQTILAFTPMTSGLFGTDGTSLKASDLIIEKPGVLAVAAVAEVPATDTTPLVPAVPAVAPVIGKYFYNSAIGEYKPTYVGDTTDLSAKVYGDTIKINQTAATGIGTAGTSYLMFPTATSEMYTMSADVNISAYNTVSSSSGVFAGVFTSADIPANGQAGSTFAMRYSAAGPNARGIYTKGTAAPFAYGAGGMNATYALNTTYNMSIKNTLTTMDYTISGETIATPASSTCGWSNVKGVSVITENSVVKLAQPVYYGIALTGVTCDVKNLKLMNDKNYIIYDMNDYYEVQSQPPVAGAITSATINADRSAINLTWDETTAAVGKGVYEIAYSTDGGTTYTVAGQTAAKKYSFSTNLATNSYIFKVYGVYKSNTTEPSYTSAVSYVKPLPKVTVTAVDNSGKVDLTWTASADATSYDVYKADSYTSLSSATLLTNVTTTSYTDTAVVNNPYYYYVIAKNDTNTSNPSDNALVLVGGLYTGAIENLGTLVYEDAAATITFDAVNDTVLTNSQTVSGKVNEAGMIFAYCGGKVQSKVIAVDEAFTFTFELTQGRNEVTYFFIDAENNITTKYDNFVYLTKYDLLVDAAFTGVDGALTGGVPTYKTISAAITSVPVTNTEAKVIFIKNGSYQERLDISAPYISLIGEDSLLTSINKSVIVGIAGSTGMTNRNVVAVQAAATGFTAENLTIENTYPYKNGSGEQADALMLNADQAIIVNVRLVSFQDTLLTYNQNARQVFYRCYITGNVDFIYGTSTVLFSDCDIVGRYTSYKADGCYLAPQTMKTSTYGYVFNGCRFTSEAGVGENQYRLARTYGEASAAIFNECYLGKAVRHADVLCFEVMNYPLSTARYYECKSFGPAAKVVAGRALVSSAYIADVEKNLFVTDFSTLPAFDEIAMDGMYIDADYTAINTLIAEISAMIQSNYVDFSAVTAAVVAVVFDLNATQQEKVNAMATNITNAINALVLKDADYTALTAAIASAEAFTAETYTTESFAALSTALTAAKAVATGLKADKQGTINDAVTALNSAVTALVKEPIVIPATGSTDTKIVDPSALLEKGSKFEVKLVTSGAGYENAATIVKAASTSEFAQFAVFEMNLTNADNVAVTQLPGKVSVTLPVPAGLDITKTISVYRIETNGTLSKLDTKIVDGKIVFETDHFSTYVIAQAAEVTTPVVNDTTPVETPTTPQTGDTTPIAMYMIIMSIAAGSVLYATKKRKIRRV